MLVLFESPAGYAVFKVDESKLQEIENLFDEFETAEGASKVVKLKHFEKFQDMTEALSAATALVEGKVTKKLKKVLKKIFAKDAHEQLAVADAKLGGVLKEKLNISCVSNSAIQELMRCIRSQMDNLISGLPKKEMTAMALGLAHSLSRYKLKFSPDKIDTMIIQAVSLLDDLDKELNNYIMRCKEWYGWHFPELSKLVTDNHSYIMTVKQMGMRENASKTDFSEFLTEDIEEKVKELAEVSMGTEISEQDLDNILYLCNEIVEMSTYRTHLSDYLKNRMMAVAPNLTVMVGELVGARLISHAGSLINLAKHPASTVQILGAEKALFRALKAKHDTPKYGLIYHATLVGQATAKLKGKISRMLAAKTSLACRVDALGEETNSDLGLEHRAKLESRLKVLEEGGSRKISGTGKAKAKWEKYETKSEILTYPAAADSTLPSSTQRKRKWDEDEETPTTDKKLKTEPEEVEKDVVKEEVATPKSDKKKKKKKRKSESEEQETSVVDTSAPEIDVSADVSGLGSEKKKKKKKKQKDDD